MRIVRLSYNATNWELQDLELGKVNLIVGKNATGKSRALKTIDFIARIFTQKRDISLSWLPININIIFLNKDNQQISYSLSMQDKEVKEKMEVDGKELINRVGEEAKILNELTQTYETVYPPKNKLVMHTNRDLKKFPYLESVTSWAENVYAFKFGHISPHEHINREYDALADIDDVPELVKKMSAKQIEKIVIFFNTLGYCIDKLKYAKLSNKQALLTLEEEGVEGTLDHLVLSQGMFRTLALLIYLEYLVNEKQPATLLIDDLCEGLDYDRATKLGKIVFEICEQNDIQLLATSNDSFLMEVVDIKNWNILQRNGQIVTAINNQNSADLFKEFRFTGMSNFDLLASDFITQKTAKI